jgi:hypothetical protein
LMMSTFMANRAGVMHGAMQVRYLS